MTLTERLQRLRGGLGQVVLYWPPSRREIDVAIPQQNALHQPDGSAVKRNLTQTTVAAPDIFLGADGQWMFETLRTFIRRLRPTPAVEPVVAVAAE